MQKRKKRWLVAMLLGGTAVGGGGVAFAVGGNISPDAIQIDVSADLYANLGTPQNSGATLDWVLDGNDNTGTGCLGSDAIATCVEPGVTGAVGGAGHWNGVRIVDGIDGDDLDIFLTGGKENDVSTWNPGPGSIGSAKYDVTQAYLANNQTTLFFGMERRGINGTTAFDFEFNAKAPGSLGCPQSAIIPCRTAGDVLFTFEAQGSGNNGSVTPHVFTWDGTTFVEQSPLPAGILTSINNAATPAAPWGYVDSKGEWTLGNLPRFAFAEAAVPIGAGGIILPGVNTCGGNAFVQVRTRSSATPNSDLKDLTKIFNFVFAGVTASASKTSANGSTLAVTVTGTTAGGADTFQWQRRIGGGAWVNIQGATSTTLTYSSFETDFTNAGATPAAQSFTVSSDSYAGQRFDVDLRLNATRGSCPLVSSDPVTVKKLIAVDP